MASLLIITSIEFWKNQAGHQRRLQAILHFLKGKIAITIAFGGHLDFDDQNILGSLFKEIEIISFRKNGRFRYKDFKDDLCIYLTDKSFDFALIEYVEMAFALPLLNPNCITLLDTHDLISDRIESFEKSGLTYDGIRLSPNEEFEIFACFDYVIAIQEADYQKLRNIIPIEKLLLVPHPSKITQNALRPKISNIGFVASAYLPNADALNWFLVKVWSNLNIENVYLNIYGKVCDHFSLEFRLKFEKVIWHGWIQSLDEIYSHTDVLINPVRCGAGLKIKNIEAICSGIPLITTSHGAIGMAEGIGSAFLVADTETEFKVALEKLCTEIEFRKDISVGAFQYGTKQFSAEKCFEPLSKVLLQGHPISLKETKL